MEEEDKIDSYSETHMPEKTVEQVKEIFKKDEYVKISGINAFGDPFTAYARIAADDNGNPAVYDTGIMLDFGNRNPSDNYKGRILAYYSLIFPKYFFGTSLIILEVTDCNDNVLFKNPNANLVKETAKQKLAESEKKAEKEGRTIPSDPVSKKIREKIGNPVILYDAKSNTTDVIVPASCQSSCYHGEPIVEINCGPICGNTYVHEHSSIYTLSEVKLASNYLANVKFKPASPNFEG